MKVSILGSGLTSLTLAKILINQGINVDIFSDQKSTKDNKIQTLGISKSNIDFFNENILNIKKFLWDINRIEIFSENLKNEKLLNFGYENKIQAVCSDSFKWLKTNKQKFDLIFLDPPFDLIDYKILIRAIFKSNVLNEDGKIFLESNKHTSLEISKPQDILKDKTLGDVRLMILQ